MNALRRILLAALAVSLTATLSLAVLPAAAAQPDGLEARTAAILAANPGGERLAPGVLSWHDGSVVLTLQGAVSQRSIGSCLTGQYCAWSGTNYVGTKLAFTGCSTSGSSSSLALLGGVVRSTANARTSGTVQARNGGNLVYSMSANTGVAVNGSTLSQLVCYS
jgi:hypothetical protein